MKKNKKSAITLIARDELVSRAANKLFESYEDGWARSVFDDFLIVCVTLSSEEYSMKYYRVPYIFDEESNDVVIEENRELWQEVTLEWVNAKMNSQVENDGMVAIGERITKTYKKDNLGYVEAPGIIFGNSDQKDLEGDYFTSDTDYGPIKGNGVAVTLNHRQPLSTQNSTTTQKNVLNNAAKRFFKFPIKTTLDEGVGIIASHVLDLSDDYEKMIYDLTERGKFRWSSGTAGHLVDREKDGKIKTWHIVEFAYTPFAAEPRLPKISPIKNLKGESLSLKEIENEGNTTELIVNTKKGKNEMTKEEMKALFDEQFEAVTENFKASYTKENDERFESLGGVVTKLLNMMESLPIGQRAGFVTDDGGTADKKVKSFSDFLMAVRRGDHTRLMKVYGSQYEHETKAMGEDSGPAGGYTVPEEIAPDLLQITATANPILSKVQKVPVTRPSGEWPALDQYFTPSAGVGNTAYAGHVVATATEENTSLTSTDPLFNMLQWRLHKIGGYTQVSNELISDSALAIEALLRGLFNVAVNGKREYLVLRGSGVGEFLGILNSNAAINVTPNVNGTFNWADVAAMQSHFKPVGNSAPVWLIHPSQWANILQMEIGTAGASAWSANMQASNGNMINGYQILQSEHLPQTTNRGSVILADLSGYIMWEKSAMSIAFSSEVGFLTDQGTWRFTSRADGKPWLKGPITLADPQGSYTVSPFVIHND